MIDLVILALCVIAAGLAAMHANDRRWFEYQRNYINDLYRRDGK